MTEVVVLEDISPEEAEARLNALVARHQKAGGLVIDVLNLVGGQAETLMARLPQGVRDNLDGATQKALSLAMDAAHSSRRVTGPQPGWMNTAIATAMGAAGGFGGLPSAMAELPVTTTVLLRAIQDVAAQYGFDPAAQNVQFDCIQVFAAAGPMATDDGADLAFLSTRLTVTGAAMNALIARVAPRLATVLGQKLAAQTVPILGAAAGAATNYAYINYYQEMAHIHFGMRKLAIESDRSHDALIEDFRARLTARIEKK